jgi:hypothetical protein
MNIDFHYYGTYTAAKFAGYSDAEATTIAHAAQYVDDSYEGRLLRDKITDFKLIPTVHTLTDMVLKDFIWTENAYNELLQVWPVFHFLPGNYDMDNAYRYPYIGKNKGNSVFDVADVWSYDEQAKAQFKLVCLPNSILTKAMVNDLVANWRTNLHAIGLRMHVLADTWAHTYYAGTPAWFINQEAGNYLRNAKAYNDIIYLGHASTGHRPDNPSLVFEVGMQWNGYKKIKKDNPADYLKAIKQLTQAMRCIRTGQQFENGTYFDIGSSAEETITAILGTVTGGELNDQTEIWKAKIPMLMSDGKSLKPPEAYDADAWLNVVKKGSLSSAEIKNTDYYKFNFAASRHLQFVKETLSHNFVYLDDVPDNWVFKYDIKDSRGYFVSNIYDGIFYFYPTYSATKPNHKLQFIFPNKSQGILLSGDIAYIKTLEEYSYKIWGPGRYLGAWLSVSPPLGSIDIYFYVKEYSPARQKWVIEQTGKNVGEMIDMAKPVTIKNVFFDKKTYLAPHEGYLTTQSDKYEWFLIP